VSYKKDGKSTEVQLSGALIVRSK